MHFGRHLKYVMQTKTNDFLLSVIKKRLFTRALVKERNSEFKPVNFFETTKSIIFETSAWRHR